MGWHCSGSAGSNGVAMAQAVQAAMGSVGSARAGPRSAVTQTWSRSQRSWSVPGLRGEHAGILAVQGQPLPVPISWSR